MNARSCCVAALLACTGAQAAPRATVELLPQAEVTGDAVSLGQIAHLSSPELALLRRLVDLPIGRVPRDGQPAFVRRAALVQWVRRETGLTDDDLAWAGSEAARVTRLTRHVKASELALAATEALRAWMAQRGAAGEIRLARSLRDLEAPAGELQLRPRSLEGAALRSRMLVWVEVWSEGTFVRAVPVPLEVDATLLAESPAPASGALAAAPFEAAKAAQSQVLVERGAWATLRSTDGAVSLESKVSVLQDGRAGDQVRVRAPGGAGIVFARVVGPAQVELAP
jgi:flagellar basal body P-ring formation protein FlgA